MHVFNIATQQLKYSDIKPVICAYQPGDSNEQTDAELLFEGDNVFLAGDNGIFGLISEVKSVTSMVTGYPGGQPPTTSITYLPLTAVGDVDHNGFQNYKVDWDEFRPGLMRSLSVSPMPGGLIQIDILLSMSRLRFTVLPAYATAEGEYERRLEVVYCDEEINPKMVLLDREPAFVIVPDIITSADPRTTFLMLEADCDPYGVGTHITFNTLFNEYPTPYHYPVKSIETVPAIGNTSFLEEFYYYR